MSAQAKDKKEAPKEPEVPVEQVDEENQEPSMGEDEFYPDGYIDKPLEDSSLSTRNKKFFGCQGIMSYKRFNLHYLEDHVIVYVTGNTYQIYNIETKEKKIFRGLDTDGIGSISVHPSRKYFAVAEKGKSPNIYIYEYPSMRLYRILRKGTENLYAHIEFSVSGTKIASIGGAPDYTITVWDWKAQRVVLKAKAFSQEVFRVSFSPYTDDILFTSGSGHIRFWRMAQTFTGLKLQGEIGKFGQLELSDVMGFAELPDGKVVCGSEYGTLILWEGNLVKAHLVLDQLAKTPLHHGPIEVVLLDGDHFITAGGDGYIKWWRYQDVDNAEADERVEVQIAPVKEKIIRDETNNGEPAYIVNMIKGHDHWLILDGKGKLWKMMIETMEVKQLMHFHSGKIQDLAASQTQNASVSIGQDGQVKLWDFIKDREFYSRRFLGSGTCMDLMPYSEANQGKVVATGFDNGIVRILLCGSNDFQILKAFKAHDSAVVKVKYASDNTMFASASKNGEIFFFLISGHDNLQKYEPLCMINIPSETPTTINDMRWDSDSNNLLVGCSNGYVYEVSRPRAQDIDNTETFLTDNVQIRSWRIKMMEFQMKKNQKKDEEEEEKKRRMRLRGELPKEEEEQEEDWDPEPILACMYMNDGTGRFLVSSQGLFTGFLYLCDFNQVRPLKAIEIPKTSLCRYLDVSPSLQFIIIGFENGEIQIRCIDVIERLLRIRMHDGQVGKITSAKFDREEKFLITSAEDGLIYVHLIDKENLKKESVFQSLEGVEGADFMAEAQREEIRAEKIREYFEANPPYFPEVDLDKDGIDHNYLSQSVRIMEEVNEDIIDPSQYSIQQAKLRTEEDHRLKLAEEKKEGVKERIKKLRKAFKELRVRNSQTEEWVKITEEDFNIDPVYFDMLKDRNLNKIEEAKKEVAWYIEFHTAKLNKLKQKFYDVLEFEKFTVKSIKTSSYVTTFRVHKMSEFLEQNIETFKQMLETEMLQGNGSIDYNDDNEAENLDATANANNNGNNDKNKEGGQTKTSMNQTKKQQQQQASMQAKKTEAEKKREERKLQREARKKKIEKLEKKEAMHSGEDPADRKMIDEAMATYGDHKLKISAKYIVPENQRVNFSKKRQQMVLLEGSIHKLKVDFNKKIQELKIRKKEIIERVKRFNGRLGEINGELGEVVELFEPTIDENAEYPEKFFDVNDADIEGFRKQKLEKQRAEAAAKKSSNMMGPKKQQQAAQDDPGVQAQTTVQLTEAQKQAEFKVQQEKVAEERKKNQGVDRKGKKAPDQSELDEEMRQIRRIELIYERDQINSEIDSLINAFDEEIKEMQKEKYRLESDLKQAEMKLVIFFEELILLKSMESRDQELTKMLAKCRQDKGQILREINDISKQLREKKSQIDSIKSREEELMVKFHDLCPEGSDKYDEIRKYFEKIMKRKQKPKALDREAGDGEDEEDEGDEEEEFEEDEEDEEDENNVVSLPQEEYKIDDIEKLRDERNLLYGEKDEILKFINDLEQSRKKLENNEKKIKAELEETEEEIQDFQKEKMAKLNQLEVSIVLKVKQLQNLDSDQTMLDKWRMIREKEIEAKHLEMQQQHHDGDSGVDDQQRLQQLLDEEDYRGYYLPKTLKDSILFTRTQLLSLINRKRELDEEQINLEKQFREYKKDHNTKKKEIKENEKIRAVKEREYNERQMLRFGNLVDLDNLEVSGPSNTVLDLQNKFQKTEKKCIKMIEEADGEMEKTQRELTQAIKENTNLLNLIRELGEKQLQLNRNLDSTNKAIFVDEDDEDKRNMMEEKQRLKKLLELQAKEIETLKAEINLYKKKGGHIYTKVTTNRRVANLEQQD